MAIIETKKFALEVDQLIIESAKVEEAEEIIAFMKNVDQETDFLIREEGEFDLTVEQEEEFIRNKMRDRQEVFLKARLEGKIVGTVGFSTPKQQRYRHQGEFGMAVLKDYWGYGIGSNLLKVLIDWADQAGYSRICLRVDATNQRAREVYNRLDFKEEGLLEKNKRMKNGLYRDEIVMALINEDNL